MADPDLLTLRGIVKRFPGMVALDHVDFSVKAGEVHALMGENGAGKSTLIKIMTGALALDEGEILLEGATVQPRTTFEAAQLGIRPVYQEVNLAPNLSVAENICLGQFNHRRVGLGWKQMVSQAEEAVAKLSLQIDVQRPLSDYSVALQQMIAIARAVAVTPKVLVLDEPTSSLDAGEVEQVFAVVRHLRNQGLGIIFVSHFIDQVFAISDRITVLRNGKMVAVDTAQAMGPQGLVRHMIGRGEIESPTRTVQHKAPTDGPTVLAAEGIGRRSAVHGVSLNIQQGDVVGLAGLLGSGRTETLRLLFGADKRDTGQLSIHGQPTGRWTVKKSIRSGFGFCTEDRKVSGIIPELSVRENIILALQARRNVFAPLSASKQREVADRMVAALRVATTDIDKPIQFLSGGNQQKCLLARWLVTEPKLLLLDEPTRGIDIGAKQEILELINDLREKGMSLVIADSELAELLRVATEIAVLRDREFVASDRSGQLKEEAIMALMAEGTA